MAIGLVRRFPAEDVALGDGVVIPDGDTVAALPVPVGKALPANSGS